MAKIIGIRTVVSDLKNTPRGFHQEVWGWQDDAGNVHLYTSEYLSQNCWTANHDEGEHRVDGIMREIMHDDEYDGIKTSMTEALKRAVAQVWGI